MHKILLSAFACDPTKGSEPSYGWNWAVGLAERGFEVHCITREISRAGIETRQLPRNLKFSYVRLPYRMERLYSASQSAMYIYYMLWQWRAYKLAVALHRAQNFELVHHITWGNLQLGSFMYKLRIPLVFGPAGGGQMAPTAFREYFGDAWPSEQNRERMSRLLLRFNPACKTMLSRAAIVLASNKETLRLAQATGAGNVSLALDTGVPAWFFPKQVPARVPQKDSLKLLWVGRFMPRKGLMLLLDVMKELKEYPGIELTVVGDGIQKPEFVRAIDKYGLQGAIHLKGWVPFEMVRSYYANHDVFLFTSLRESGGVQIVEAMAFGMPVVTLDLHGPGSIVDSDRGIKCACDTPDTAIQSLKAAILDLYNNPGLIERLSEGSSQFAARQVWQKKIDAIVEEFYC